MKRKQLPKYVSAFVSQSGRTRYQFRRKGCPRYYFAALPWTDEFMEEYRACMAGAAARLQPGAKRMKPGSLAALIATYYGSSQYQGLRDSTKGVYRRIMEGLRAKHGEKPVAGIERRHIKALIDAKAGTPHAANRLLKMFRLLMAHAVEIGWRRDDPTIGIKFLRVAGDGIRTWTEEDVAKFEAHHPPGSMARRAMTLMLYTGQRKGDAVTLGRQHVRGGRITIVQSKTRTRLEIPIHPTLAAELALAPADQMTFLQTSFGKPFTANGFGNRMREWCNEAGLPQCSSHGLRKLMAVRLAESGRSAPEIASITGHQSLQEVQRYIKAADQKRLSEQAMLAIGGTIGERKMSHVENPGDNSAAKALKKKGA